MKSVAWIDYIVPMRNDSKCFDWNEEGLTQLPQYGQINADSGENTSNITQSVSESATQYTTGRWRMTKL